MRRFMSTEGRTMSSTEPWQFLVVRTQNLHFLRPEKTWRPIVTLEVDDARRSSHEVILGTDGQNPNLKQPMLLEEVHHGSRLEIRVWHRSQTKAKRRKAHLVGSASALLGEVVKRQGDDRHVEIRLSCTSAQRRKSAVQKQSSAASLLVRVAPPRALSSASAFMFSDEDYDDGDDGSVISSRKSPGSTLVSLPEEGDAEDAGDSTLTNEPSAQLLRRRRRKVSKPKPYCLDSDAAEPSESEYESESAEDSEDGFPPDRADDGETFDDDTGSLRVRIRSGSVSDVSFGIDGGSAGSQQQPPFCAPSTLPAWRATSASDAVSVASTVSFASSMFDTFTYYRELREAQLDCDFESILLKLMGEWYYVGASLLAVAGLDTAVFGFSPDAIFGVDTFAKRAVTVSSIAAGIGIGIDAWFLFAYSGADVRKFQTLAVDLYSSFFFFSLTSRMPLVALLVAAVTLMLFLFAIAWSAWPTAVLAMSFISGTLFSLQFIVYGCHRAVLAAVWGAQGVGRGARWAWGRALGRRGEDVEDAGAGDPRGGGAEAVTEMHMRSVVGAGQPQIHVSFAPVVPREPEPCR